MGPSAPYDSNGDVESSACSPPTSMGVLSHSLIILDTVLLSGRGGDLGMIGQGILSCGFSVAGSFRGRGVSSVVLESHQHIP